jgi:hypothetical protein
MRKILAITVALMIAAIVIMPALGYTNQAAGNQSYSAKSGSPAEYSLKTINVPAHNLTPDMVVDKYSFKSSGVASTRVAYSFQKGANSPYSFKLIGVENAVAEGTAVKPTAKLGNMAGDITDAAATGPASELAAEPAPAVETASTPAAEPAPAVETASTPAAEPAAAPAPETAAPVAFSIEGTVVDNNQTGLAGWTMNLTKDGAVVNSVATAGDGKFAFSDLAAGEYTVSELLMDGWNVVSPAEGTAAVSITDVSVSDLVFVNQLAPVVAAEPAVSENATVPSNAPLDNTTVVA